MEKVTKVPSEPVLKPAFSSMPEIKLPVNNLNPKKMDSSKLIVPVVILVVAAVLGLGSGMVLAKKSISSTGGSDAVVTSKNAVSSDTEAGINDESAFPSVATGVLQAGGINGEGTHHLDRSATKEKNAALSSTIINLDNFVGKKVEIHGQTISSKTSGWLMDVGKVKVVQ